MIRRALIWTGLGMLALVAALAVVVMGLPQLLPAILPNPWAALSVKPVRGGA